jgi:hypothetical protein
MKLRVLTLSLILAFLINGCSNPKEPVSLIIQNVTVIDAVNGSQPDQTVVIKDNKIVDVIVSGTDLNYTSENIIDGTGKYLIPGLWDTHVHLTFEPDLESSMFRLFLGYGITSVRDTGGDLELVMPWKKKSMESPSTSPRVMVAGPLLDGVPTVYDGSSPMRPKLGMGASSPEEASKLVDFFVDTGVDLIKSYEMLTPEAFAAVMTRANELNKVVTGHVPLSMDVIEASNLGLRSMEHMRNLEMSISEDHDSLKAARLKMLSDGANEAGGDLRSSIHSAQRMHAYNTQDTERREVVLKALADNGTWQIPTMSIVTVGALRPFNEDSWKKNVQYLPESARNRWIQNAEGFSAAPINPISTAMTDWATAMISHLKTAGVTIMAGTDTPIAFLIPGFSLHNELSLLVEGGLTPMEALESATLLPAQYFNLQDSLGTIEKGKIADMVLLDADPLEDIGNTMKIRTVIKDGAVHNREALDGLLKH